MINIVGRSLKLSAAEYKIGFEGDNLLELRIFKVEDPTLIDENFVLDVLESDGNKNVIYLEKTVEEGSCYLTWKIKREHLRAGNRLKIQLRTIANEAGEIWHSEPLTFLIGNSINVVDSFPPVLPSEFEELERRVINAKNEVISISENLSILVVQTPYIGENGNWFIFDNEQNAFVDSGVDSKGNKGDSPIRGIDFWTSEDKEEIVSEAAKIVENNIQVPTNLVNGQKTGSLRTIGSYGEHDTYKLGYYAFAEGDTTKASGNISHAEGDTTSASGETSHAEGVHTSASGHTSHAEGEATSASGDISHAEGGNTSASGDYSHAQNTYTIAHDYAETAIGSSNIESNGSNRWNINNSAFVVGNGTSNNRSNAFQIMFNGTVKIWNDIVCQVPTMLKTTAKGLISAINELFEGKADKTALTAEITARQGTDASLQTQIDTKASVVALNDETTARQSQFSSLANQIADKADKTALTAETTARETAILTLANTKADRTALTAETESRQSVDNNLQAQIDTKASVFALNDETTARQSQFSSLANQIADKASDAALTAEITARREADVDLQSQINTKQNKITAQTYIIETEPWTNQPAISGALHEDFSEYTTNWYFVTLLDENGAPLLANQFKLTLNKNGHTSATDQIFTLQNLNTGTENLVENSVVDFKETGAAWKIRNGGVRNISAALPAEIQNTDLEIHTATRVSSLNPTRVDLGNIRNSGSSRSFYGNAWFGAARLYYSNNSLSGVLRKHLYLTEHLKIRRTGEYITGTMIKTVLGHNGNVIPTNGGYADIGQQILTQECILIPNNAAVNSLNVAWPSINFFMEEDNTKNVSGIVYLNGSAVTVKELA